MSLVLLLLAVTAGDVVSSLSSQRTPGAPLTSIRSKVPSWTVAMP